MHFVFFILSGKEFNTAGAAYVKKIIYINDTTVTESVGVTRKRKQDPQTTQTRIQHPQIRTVMPLSMATPALQPYK